MNNYEEIVSDFSSPSLILAGPGAGKTYLLADRVNRLLDKGIHKTTITVLTFGKDANQHMINKLTDPNGEFKLPYDKLPRISTMHSLGLEIVKEKPREAGLLKTDLQIQEDENVKELMYRDAALILGHTELDGQVALKCKQYGECKKNLEEKKCQICSKYREIMVKCNYVDFDDLILFACHILENNQDILEKYQSQATHLLVDEYQDINAAQFRLIELLSRRSRNGLFAVGDDSQSIFGFRGCDPKFILNFKKDFPGSKTPPLVFSRRCHEKIMNDAIKVLEAYYNTDWKKGQALEYKVPIGKESFIWQLPSESSEAKVVAQIARSSIMKGKSVLILVPKKDFFPLIINELTIRGIAHDCPESFLPKRIRVAKLFIDWLTMPTHSFRTRLVVEEIINNGIARIAGAKKNKKIKQETLKKRIEEEIKIAKLWEQVDKTNDLFNVIKNLKHADKIIDKIREGLTCLLTLYADVSESKYGDFAKQLAVVSGIWCEPSKLEDDIINIVKVLGSRLQTGIGFAQFKTMRKAKGLEADVVIIVGLEDDIVPDPRSELIEQARLFYVSMTRAKQELYLLHSWKRHRSISYGIELQDKKRSSFLDKIGRQSEYKDI